MKIFEKILCERCASQHALGSATKSALQVRALPLPARRQPSCVGSRAAPGSAGAGPARLPPLLILKPRARCPCADAADAAEAKEAMLEAQQQYGAEIPLAEAPGADAVADSVEALVVGAQ